MSDKRIKSFLEDRLKMLERIRNEREFTTAELGDIACCKQTLAFIDSLQEEPVSEQNLSNVQRTVKDWKEEPVSEIDFEQELYKAFGHVKDFALGMRIAKWFYNMGRNHQEPVSEWLIEELKKIVNIRECVSQGVPVIKIACHFAQWQKQQMMKDAVERTVKVDAGGYPYIDETELYDYDKDEPLAKAGDKVKIYIFKED